MWEGVKEGGRGREREREREGENGDRERFSEGGRNVRRRKWMKEGGGRREEKERDRHALFGICVCMTR